MLKAQEILHLVDQAEADKMLYRREAAEWEKMWSLKAFDESKEDALLEGREQVVLPDPYNVVQLATRLFSSRPSITCPSEDVTADKDDSAQKRQKFLEALWHRANREQRKDLIKEAAMYGLIRGRFAFDIRWIGNALSENQKKRRMPILVRTLDPLNVGEKRGPLGLRWAYHLYEESFPNIVQQWPKAKGKIVRSETVKSKREENESLNVLDFWWINADGEVWNAVLVEDKFAKAPSKTDYPDIPIVTGFADYSPIGGEEHRGLSILHPMNGTWQYRCRLASQMGTGVLWYFWPAITVMNEMGHEVPDIQLKPGQTTNLPYGTKVDTIRFEPNVPIAQMMQSQLAQADQQSSFPGVLYGQAPGDIQAGYAISILSEAARGRISDLMTQLEMAISNINEIALGLVEKMATSKGVSIWGYDEAKDRQVHVGISPDDIDGYLENYVRIPTNVPNDDMGKKAMGLQEVDKGIISTSTYRQNYSTFPMPADEAKRVMLERAMQNPELQQRAMEIALQEYWGEEFWSRTGQTPPDEGASMPPPEVPGYSMANGPANCASCAFASAGQCTLYNFKYDPQFSCQSWTAPEGMMQTPQQGGPPGMQNPSMAPGMPSAMQGQITPDMLGLNPNAAPGPYQAAMGEEPPTLETLAQRARGRRGSSE